MERFPGVFTSSLADAEWEPHRFGGEIFMLTQGPEVESGLYRFAEAPEPFKWTIHHRETKLVLEGACRIEYDDGPVLEFTAGDMFSLRPGDATWHFTAPYREFYVLML
ncbi:MAG TPA: cupin domain-containing protein [Propionicimonas sp.]|jgi:uncharacterized cupin superfamily protein